MSFLIRRNLHLELSLNSLCKPFTLDYSLLWKSEQSRICLSSTFFRWKIFRELWMCVVRNWGVVVGIDAVYLYILSNIIENILTFILFYYINPRCSWMVIKSYQPLLPVRTLHRVPWLPHPHGRGYVHPQSAHVIQTPRQKKSKPCFILCTCYITF